MKGIDRGIKNRLAEVGDVVLLREGHLCEEPHWLRVLNGNDSR